MAEPAPEAAFQKRRRLRDERAALVSKLARRGSSDHRSVNAWVNRAVGVTSVADATADQLQRSITVLEAELDGDTACQRDRPAVAPRPEASAAWWQGSRRRSWTLH